MKLILMICFFALPLLTVVESALGGPKREIQIEWATIQDAISYDIELVRTQDQVVILKGDGITDFVYKALLEPGSYQVRVRSRDDRGLAGRWGPPQLVLVPEFPIIVNSPKEGESIQAEKNIGLVSFKWEFPNPNTELPITIQIFSINPDSSNPANKSPVHSITASGKSKTIELPIGASYEARFFHKDSASNVLEKVRFHVVGLPLDPPEIHQALQENRPIFKFSMPDGAQSIVVTIQGLDQKDGQFKILSKTTLTDQLQMSLEELPPTRPLLIQARSESSSRGPSINKTYFLETDITAKKIDESDSSSVFRRSASSTIFARYNFSSANYLAQSFENANVSTSSGITGTLQVGGSKFSELGTHGFSSQLELGGLTIEDSNYTFVRSQVSYLYRKSLRLPFEFRCGLGLRFATLPEVNKLADNSIRSGTSWSAGPNLSLELWYQVSPKIAVHTEFSGSYAFLGESSTKAKVTSGQSYQYSVNAAYRWSPNIIASIGILGSNELLVAPGKNPVGDLAGDNQLQLRSQGAIAGLEWSLP